jgi:hypothetical protein
MEFTVPHAGRRKCRANLSSRDPGHNRRVALGRDFSTMASGSVMRHSTKQFIGYGWLFAALAATAACSPRRIPPMSVEELMADRVSLDGIIMKCDQNLKLHDTAECANARTAIDRLSSQDVDPTVDKKRQEEFERAREQLRLSQERQRREQEDKTKVDAYSLPVVPVTPTVPAGGTAPAAAPSSGAGAQTSGTLPRSDTATLAGTATP